MYALAVKIMNISVCGEGEGRDLEVTAKVFISLTNENIGVTK